MLVVLALAFDFELVHHRARVRPLLLETPVPKLTVLHNGRVVGEVERTGDSVKDVAAVREYLKARGLRHEPSVTHAMFAAATGFADTSSQLYRECICATPPRVGGFIPFVVNSAFSVELYLKTLGKLFGVDLRGHDLSKLYDELPAAAREQIDLVAPACAKNRGLPEDMNYAGCVRIHRKAFEEWRYLYEQKQSCRVEFPVLIFTMEAAHEVCRKYRAEIEAGAVVR